MAELGMGRKGLNGKEGKHNSTPERGEYSLTLHITGLPLRSMRCVVTYRTRTASYSGSSTR